jgi:nucleoid-associated protein YgaU
MVTSPLRQPPLRLTRRGRAVVLGFFVLMASLASAILLAGASRADEAPTGPVSTGPAPAAPASTGPAPAAPASPGPAPTGPAPSVVVQPHDTLWSIATRAAPERDPFAAIAEIKKINDLEGYVVHPGQTLELPR